MGPVKRLTQRRWRRLSSPAAGGATVAPMLLRRAAMATLTLAWGGCYSMHPPPTGASPDAGFEEPRADAEAFDVAPRDAATAIDADAEGDGDVPDGGPVPATCTPAGARAELVWAQTGGSTNWNHAFAVAADDAGRSYAAGSFSDVVDFGGGPLDAGARSDAFVTSVRADGTHRWATQMGVRHESDRVRAIASDGAEALYVTGFFGMPTADSPDRRAVLAKLHASDGRALWSRAAPVLVFDVAVTPDGGVVISGEIDEAVDFGGGVLDGDEPDAFVVAYGPDGSHRWSRRFGGDAADKPFAVAGAPDGTLYVGGRVHGDLRIGDVHHPDEGRYVEAFVSAWTGEGRFRWARVFGADRKEAVTDIVTDERGRPYVAVRGHRVSLIAFARDGTRRWSVPGSVDPEALAKDDASIYMGGAFRAGEAIGDRTLTAGGGSDAFVASFDPCGNLQWVRTPGGESEAVVWDLASGSEGPIAAGAYGSGGSFGIGDRTFESRGNFDMFIAHWASRER